MSPVNGSSPKSHEYQADLSEDLFYPHSEFSRLHEVVEAALLCEGPPELTLVTMYIRTNGALGLFEHNFYLLAHDY